MLGYSLLLLLITQGLFILEDEPIKALISLVQVITALVPLVAMIFTVVYTYDSAEFTQLLAVQPIARRSILMGQVMAMAFALLVAELVGLGLPLVVNAPQAASFVLFAVTCALTLVFTALGVLIALKQPEKARGVGVSLVAWLFFILVFDALLMWLMFSFSEWPIEPLVVPIASLNPVDLARILVMLQIDLAAMMGYSGAVYKDFFGSTGGMFVAAAFLLLWIFIPLLAAFHVFRRKDL